MAKAPEVEHLLQGVRSGDTHSFERLVRTLTEPLYHYAATIVRDPGAAEEVVQNTFIRVFKRRKALDASMSLRGYCYRITTNLARNHIRDRRLRRERETEALDMREHITPDPQLAAVAREAWQLLNDLPDDLRSTLQLRYGHGLTLAEVGQALEIPEGTVSTRQRNGLQKLRDRLALALPVIPGLDQIGGAMDAVAPPTVAASPGLVNRVETIVMASVGTKSTINVIILAVAAVLLIAGGVVVAAVVWPTTLDDTGGIAGRPSSEDGLPKANSAVEQPLVNQPGNAPAAGVDEETPPEAPGETGDPEPEGVSYTATVRGTIVDSRGAPVAGAEVMAVPVQAYTAQELGVERQSVGGAAKSDAGGEFELSLTGRCDPQAEQIFFALVPTAKDYAGLLSNTMWVQPGGVLDGVRLRLFRSGRVEGRVVLASDTSVPVPDVQVSTYRVGGDEATGVGSLHEVPEVKTGADGGFAFDALPPGGYSIYVKSGTGSGHIRPGEHSDDVRVLEGETTQGVQVLYSGDALVFETDPPVDCTAELVTRTRADGVNNLSVSLGSFFSINAGKARVTGLKPSVTSVSIKIPGYVPVGRTLNVEPGHDVDLGVLKLEAGNRLSVRVVDSNGNGVEEAKLYVYSGVTLSAAATVSDQDGNADLLNLELVEYELTVSAPGYAKTIMNVVITPESGDKPLQVELKPEARIVGRVTINGRTPTLHELGATGTPALSVYVRSADRPEEGGFFKGLELLTSNVGRLLPDGRYVVNGLGEGSYRVFARIGEVKVSSDAVGVATGEEVLVDIDVPSGGGISGRVVGRDGKGLARTSIYLVTDALDMFWLFSSPSTKTDFDGNYRFENIPAGVYYFRLESDPDVMGSAMQAARKVSVENGEQTEFNLDLSANAGPSIFGRVTLDGEPRFREAVLVKPDAMLDVQTARMDDTGRFELTGIRPGRYYLWFTDNKWSPTLFVRQSVEIGEDEQFDVTRDFPGLELKGRVVVAGEGDSFDMTTVTVRLAADFQDDIGTDSVKSMAGAEVKCDAQGFFEFPNVVAGRYRVEARAKGIPTVERGVAVDSDSFVDLVAAGRAGELKLVIGEIAGEETAGPLPEGSPLSSVVRIRLRDSSGNEIALPHEQTLVSLATGKSTTLSSLLPGAYTVEVFGLHVEPLVLSADVEAGATSATVANLHRAGEVHLRFDNPELREGDLAEIAIEIYDADGLRLELDRSADKAFGATGRAKEESTLTVRPLKEGAYRIVCKLNGYTDLVFEVQVGRARIVTRSGTFLK